MARPRCGFCNQNRRPRLMYGGEQPVFDPDGFLPLATYPDCTEPYAGELVGERLYIVGWGHPNEAVFAAARAKRAVGYARGFYPPLRIDEVFASQLCAAAVEQALNDANADTS